jgi:hypothetical protein
MATATTILIVSLTILIGFFIVAICTEIKNSRKHSVGGYQPTDKLDTNNPPTNPKP